MFTLILFINFEKNIKKKCVNTITTFKGSYAGRLSVTKDIDTIKTISNPSTLNSSVYNYEFILSQKVVIVVSK